MNYISLDQACAMVMRWRSVNMKSATLRSVLLKVRDEMLTLPVVEIDEETARMETVGKAERIESERPMLLHSPISRKVWLCGECGQEVDRKDRYCKGCGRRLILPQREDKSHGKH